MGAARKKFTDAYKAEAVQLVLQSGRSVAEVARDLGMNDTTLGYWVKKAKEKQDDGSGEALPSSVERERVKELEAEVRRLNMENAFQKNVPRGLRVRASEVRLHRRGGGGEREQATRAAIPGDVHVRDAPRFNVGVLRLEEAAAVCAFTA
jgi:transposase